MVTTMNTSRIRLLKKRRSALLVTMTQAYPCPGSFGKVVAEYAHMTNLEITRPRKFGAALFGICLLLSACDRPPPARTGAPADPPAPKIATESKSPVDIARHVVADFLALPEDEVTLVSVESKDFGDASLGCPAPGMSYAQVITPGHLVIVEADGRRFDVRVAGTNGRICRKPADKRVPQNSAEPQREHSSPVTSQVDEARADLAAQLDLPTADITVADVRSYAPGIASPGCHPDCPDAGAGCGVLIGLLYDGRRYEYHAYDGRTVPCPPLSPI